MLLFKVNIFAVQSNEGEKIVEKKNFFYLKTFLLKNLKETFSLRTVKPHDMSTAHIQNVLHVYLPFYPALLSSVLLLFTCESQKSVAGHIGQDLKMCQSSLVPDLCIHLPGLPIEGKR